MPKPQLEYDARTPAFLQRLKGQYAGPGERQAVQFARPKKQLLDADDDDPTYVDEDSHETISKEDYAKLADSGAKKANGELDPSSTRDESNQEDSNTPSSEGPPKLEQEPQATFGLSNKRKAVKIIDNDEEDGRETLGPKASPSATDESRKVPTKKTKPAKKAKKVKLSFDDD